MSHNLEPERMLAAAVIQNCWDHLRGDGICLANPSWRRDVQESLLLLTAANGPWAESRELWCAAIGICPAYLREKAIAEMARIAPESAGARA